MPIYEYQCKACSHVFDVLQKMSDDPLTYCPECGQPELRKLLSAPNFRLKGGGWYETDFKDKNKRNLADGKSEGGKADGKADGKTDGKAADGKAADSKGSDTKTSDAKAAGAKSTDSKPAAGSSSAEK